MAAILDPGGPPVTVNIARYSRGTYFGGTIGGMTVHFITDNECIHLRIYYLSMTLLPLVPP